MARITSRQHRIVKIFKAAARGGEDLMLLEGWHLVSEAVDAGIAIDTIAVVDRARDEAADCLTTAARRGARIVEVSVGVMDAISPVQTPAGVTALARRPVFTDADFLRPGPALIVAAAGIQDPGNVGAIVRAADAAGATGVVVDLLSADPWSWKALRAAMGSTFRVPILRVPDLVDPIERWKRAGLTVVATDPDAGTSLYAARFGAGLVLMMGAEGTGLPPPLFALSDLQVAIPMRHPVESLNVAVATALVLYEARRQRQPAGSGEA
jgi:TrmH family RNA methyltransferase